MDANRQCEVCGKKLGADQEQCAHCDPAAGQDGEDDAPLDVVFKRQRRRYGLG